MIEFLIVLGSLAWFVYFLRAPLSVFLPYAIHDIQWECPVPVFIESVYITYTFVNIGRLFLSWYGGWFLLSLNLTDKNVSQKRDCFFGSPAVSQTFESRKRSNEVKDSSKQRRRLKQLWLAKWCKIHKVYINSHSRLLLLFTNIFIQIRHLSLHSRNIFVYI